MAKKVKQEREAEEARVQAEVDAEANAVEAARQEAEAAKWRDLEKAAALAEAQESYTYDDVAGEVDAVVDDDDDDEEDASPLDILFQFIPYYGQGDPTNDATVRAYLTSLSLGEIDTKDEYGNTLLLLACQYGCDDLVRIMLNKGGDPNAVNSSGASGLHFACYRESMSKSIAKMLLHNGANPDLTEFVNGCTPLHYCASTGDVAFCEMLVQYGAEVAKQDFYHYTSVDYAREGGFTAGADYLQDVMMRGSQRGFASPYQSPMRGGGGGGGGTFFQSPQAGGEGGYNQGATPGTPRAGGGAMLGPGGEGAEVPLALSLGDPAVKAAMAESEDKHTAALNAQRAVFRKGTTERDDRIAQLRTDQDMISREIASFKEEIKDKKQMLERTEAVGSANIETLTQELEGLQADSKQLEEERGAVKTQLADLTTQLGGVEGRLNAMSAEDGAKVAAERAAAEERLVLIQEREKIYNMELNERQGGYRDEAEALKVALAEEKRAYLQESRAATNQRGALQRELEKKAEGTRRTLHELKTRQNKEKSSVTFNLEDAEARAKTSMQRRDATTETLRLTKKDIADSIEAEGFNKDIQGYIGREQQVRRTLHNQVRRAYSRTRTHLCACTPSPHRHHRHCHH